MSDDYTRQQNHLLATYPADVSKRLFRFLELAFFPLRKILYEPGHALIRVYFPIGSIVLLLWLTEYGVPAETSMVGDEGLIRLSALMGDESTTSRVVAQIACHGYGLSAP